jgi:peptidoglycan/LPS O-acetylase OafA/YrhL
LLVVVYHYTTRYAEIYGPREGVWFELPHGQYGVRLFFVISGFVIFMTLDRTPSVWGFVTSRFARLFPVFWVSMALTFGAVAWLGLPGREVPWTDGLFNLTMIPAHFGKKAIDGAYWSLYYEIGFYVIMGVIAALGLKRWSLAVGAGLVILSIFGIRELNVFSSGTAGSARVWTVHAYWFSMFLIGMTIYAMRHRVRWWHVALLGLCVGQVAMHQWYWKTKDPQHAGWPYMIVILLSGVGVFAASRWRLPILSGRVLVFFGTISYAWYLTHQNLGYIVIRRIEAVGGHPMLAMAAAFTGSILLGTALTLWIEKPANRWLRSKLSRQAKEAPPAATSDLPGPT